jgi:hypothetical protein
MGAHADMTVHARRTNKQTSTCTRGEDVAGVCAAGDACASAEESALTLGPGLLCVPGNGSSAFSGGRRGVGWSSISRSDAQRSLPAYWPSCWREGDGADACGRDTDDSVRLMALIVTRFTCVVHANMAVGVHTSDSTSSNGVNAADAAPKLDTRDHRSFRMTHALF